MPLRFRLNRKSVNNKMHVEVDYTLFWVDDAGAEQWREEYSRTFERGETAQEIIEAIKSDLDGKVKQVEAVAGLSALQSKTWERQGGKWTPL